jgi:Asp-tRNA(Asn)/Glu-tRNA(Gln) amidotransferase A subunit family amidase
LSKYCYGRSFSRDKAVIWRMSTWEAVLTVRPRVNRRDFLMTASQIAGGMVVTNMLPASPARAAEGGLVELSATAAVAAIRTGSIKAEDYARALLDRAQQLASLNVFRIFDRETVLEAAHDADKRRAAGAHFGVLHGLPIPVKDSVNTRALPTSNGTRALANFKPKNDAAVLKPLFAQGAILMGKTNLHELSFGWTSNNAIFGPVRNPYDPTRVPGGSSGGSGAAVAARIAPLAIGEDTLGSIRDPSANCGVAGLRPSFGRYPDAGIMPLTDNKFDQVGAIARSVDDLLLFDSVLVPNASPMAPKPLKDLRIGVSRGFLMSGLDPEVDRVSKEALEKLRGAGATLVEAELPEPIPLAPQIADIIIRYETMPSIASFLQKEGTGLSFDQMLAQAGENMQAAMKAAVMPPARPAREDYETMLAQRERLKTAIRRYFEEHGIAALAFPATRMPPPKIGEEIEVKIGGQKVPMAAAAARNSALGSCASMASLVLPAGLTDSGLPIGMEFAGLSGTDREMLALGLSLEKALGSIPAPTI